MKKRKCYLDVIFAVTAIFILITVSSQQLYAAACTAGNYSINISSTEITMGDSSATIPIQVNNSGSSTKNIGYVRLYFNSAIYYVSNVNESTEPSGWTATVKNAGAGQTYIEYKTTTNTIAPGGSLTFNVTLTGSGNSNILSAASNQTDSIGDGPKYADLKTSDESDCFNKSASTDTWQRRALLSMITATPSAVGSGGTITIILTVTNRSSAAQSNVQPLNSSLTVNATGTASAVLATGPTPASVGSLAAGASTTFQWTYTATAGGSGSLQFCNSARNGTGTSTSKTVCSDYVAVGDFTATISITPSQVVTGQSVAVTMTVTNSGSSTINNINPPSPLNFQVLSGTVNNSCTGPNPSTIGALAPGASSTFEWDCTITSTQIGSTFGYYGNATSGALNSQPTPAYSNTGTISAYSVTISPTTVYKGNTPVTFTFKVTNGGGYPIYKVKIFTPDTGFVYSTASGGCTTLWAPSYAGTPTQITFITGSGCTCGSAASCIPCSNGVCDFTVTYSALPNVSVNTDYNFRVDIWDTPLWKPGDSPRASIGVILKVTVNSIVAEAIPSDISPNCTSEVFATITPTPVDGQTVNFLSTGGTWQEITTTTSGEARATLRAPLPYNAAIPNATITVTYQDASASTTVIFPNATSCTGSRKKVRWREVQ